MVSSIHTWYLHSRLPDVLLHVSGPALLVVERLATGFTLVTLGRRSPLILLPRLLGFWFRGNLALLSLVLLILWGDIQCD